MYPKELQRLVDYLNKIPSQQERTQMLISYARKFKEVDESIATRPFDRSHRVEHCESEGFVWVDDNGDGKAKMGFAVENPQGISAKAFCAILQKTCDGEPLETLFSLDEDLVYHIFGKQLSMGKNMGLMGIIRMVKQHAKNAIEA
jgi:cysteine desulfuration protein SufE